MGPKGPKEILVSDQTIGKWRIWFQKNSKLVLEVFSPLA